MRVWILDDVFQGGDTPELDRIALLRAGLFRHRLSVTTRLGSPRSPTPNFDSWCAGLRGSLVREVAQVVERGRDLEVQAASIGIAVRTPKLGALTCVGVESGIRLLTQPLSLVLENARTDGAFLRQVMVGTELLAWERDGRLEFAYGGGITEMKTFLNQPLPEEWWIRRLVLVDHDGKEKNKPSKDSRAVVAFAVRHPARQRIRRLERRNQESYIPKPVMDGWVSTRDKKLQAKVDHYWRLPPTKRHFANTRSDISEGLKAVFASPNCIPVTQQMIRDDGSEIELRGIVDWVGAHL